MARKAKLEENFRLGLFKVWVSPGLAGTWEGTALGLGPVGKWPACNLWQKRGFDLYIAIYV